MKRLLDIVVSFVALLLLSPVLIGTAICVRGMLGSPVLFKQERPGLKGKPFFIVKFRTMRDAKADDGSLLPDADRMTSIGLFLRRTSLDELPELWNILIGNMSLVGPRPLLMSYLPLYSERQAKRHDVRPGLTGWAQVNGRNSLSWDEKFELDRWYVENQSLLLDLKIMCLTVWTVLKREGINAENSATAEPFRGNAQIQNETE